MLYSSRKTSSYLFALCLVACGSESTSTEPGDGDGSMAEAGDGSSDGDGNGVDVDGDVGADGDMGADGDAGGDGADDTCTATDTNIYLVDGESKLWKLEPNDDDPASSALTPIGTLDCDQGPLDIPRGLAIGSDGSAFVLMGDFNQTPWQERLYTLDLATAACGETGYQVGTAGVIGNGESAGPFGLTMMRREGVESLLMNTQVREPFAVAQIDPVTFEASPFLAGLSPGAGGVLLGVDEGRLYGAFWAAPALVDEIDTATGARSGNWSISDDSISGYRVYSDIGLAASPRGLWVFHVNSDLTKANAHYFARDSGERTDFEVGAPVLAAGSAPCAAH